MAEQEVIQTSVVGTEVAAPAEVVAPTEGMVAEPTATLPTPPDAGQADVNRLKSELQRQMYEADQARVTQLEALGREIQKRDAELYRYETAGLSSEEKKDYDLRRELEQEKAARKQQEQQYDQRIHQLEGDRAGLERREQAIGFFGQLTGLPRAELEKYADNPDNLTKFATDYIAQLRQKAAVSPPSAPQVTSSRPGQPFEGLANRIAKMSLKEQQAVIARAMREGIQASEL